MAESQPVITYFITCTIDAGRSGRPPQRSQASVHCGNFRPKNSPTRKGTTTHTAGLCPSGSFLPASVASRSRTPHNSAKATMLAAIETDLRGRRANDGRNTIAHLTAGLNSAPTHILAIAIPIETQLNAIASSRHVELPTTAAGFRLLQGTWDARGDSANKRSSKFFADTLSAA